jgi:hypothetical protein
MICRLKYYAATLCPYLIEAGRVVSILGLRGEIRDALKVGQFSATIWTQKVIVLTVHRPHDLLIDRWTDARDVGRHRGRRLCRHGRKRSLNVAAEGEFERTG